MMNQKTPQTAIDIHNAAYHRFLYQGYVIKNTRARRITEISTKRVIASTLN